MISRDEFLLKIRPVISNAKVTSLMSKEEIFQNSSEESMDKFLSIKDVCELLSVSDGTLYNWNRDKILMKNKIGGRVYYNKSDVLAILNPLKEVS